MSRCFPFPPPGYENKTSDHVDLLTKEKHKEKKHKKEKKDKEKREGKDKKEKDRSKDKHKEKKDRKEKHKDKKKDKDRDKDKNRTSNEGRTEVRNASHNEGLGDSSQKAEEVKDFKYMEELGRRIKDEEKGAVNRMVESSTSLLQKRIEGMGSGSTIINSVQKRTENTGNGTAVTGPIHKRNETFIAPNGIETMGVKAGSIDLLQRGVDTGSAVSSVVKRGIESATAGTASSRSLQKSMKSIDTGSAISGSAPKTTDSVGIGTTVSGSMQKRVETMETGNTISSSGRKKIESTGTPVAMEKERSLANKMVPNLIGAEERRNNGMGKQVAVDVEKKIESLKNSTVTEKERALGKVVLNLIGKEERRSNGTGEQVETNTEKRIEAKVKDIDSERHGDKVLGEKRSKDKDRHKEKGKEKDKMRDKGKHKQKAQDKMKDVSITSSKLSTPYIDSENSTGVNGITKKRKNLEMNGILHEHDIRPNKLPKPASSPQLLVQNGRKLELNHMALPNSSTYGIPHTVKAERVLDIKDHKANGITEACTPTEMKPSSALRPNGTETPTKPPHPDCKYLSQVYSVPEMEEWPEYDDQGWLFASENLLQKPKPELESRVVPKVWAEAMQIGSGDIFALPYVVPY